jgi:hypothetical protein
MRAMQLVDRKKQREELGRIARLWSVHVANFVVPTARSAGAVMTALKTAICSGRAVLIVGMAPSAFQTQ